MRFVVVGCGSIGRRHMRNLIGLGEHDLVAVDSDRERRLATTAEFGVAALDSLDAALTRGADAVLVCTPTAYHYTHALAAARAGCHLFIEKPIAHTLEGREDLLSVVRAQRLRTLVGCNFRFHPGLAAAKEIVSRNQLGRVVSARAQFGQYLPDWHPWEDYRRTYSARRDLGGGVILDRVHEIDYMRWLLGPAERVLCLAGRYSQLEIDTEDVAELLLQMAGIPVSIHVDYVRRHYDCRLEIVGDEATLQWVFKPAEVRVQHRDASRSVHRTWPEYDVNESYVAELRHFLGVLSDAELSQQDAADAYAVLEVALAARHAAATGEVVRL